MSEFVKIGHRGAAGHEPENTFRSFVKAIKLGADAIEFDMRLSADKKVVVIHDATLDRTTNGKGLVSNFSYNELRRLDAGKGEKIPTLEQVFGVLGKGNPWGWKPFFNVELKEADMVDDVLNLIRQYHLVDSVVVSTLATWVLNDLFAIKRNEPDLRIAMLVDRKELFWTGTHLAADFPKIYAVSPIPGIITKRKVTIAHAKGIKVFVWTVNQPSDIARIKAMGVDGIFSDYPDRL